MKKNLFFLLLLAIIAVSCQKDIEPGSVASSKTNEIAPTATKQTSLFDEDKPIENDDVFKKIEAFKAKIAKIEAGTMPETDNGTSETDAIWNIEALMNSQHGRADKPFTKISSATSTIRVALNDDGTISNSALVIALNEAELKLNEQFSAVNTAQKHIIAVDVSRKVPQVEASGSLLLSVSSSVGSGGSAGPPPPGDPFGAGDSWLWGYHQGRCNGANVSIDAADKLNEAINPRLISVCTFFTDIDIIQAGSGLPNPNSPGPNIRSNLFFVRISNLPNFSGCIDDFDMNFYYYGAKTMINLLKPAGKSFINIDILGTSTSSLIYRLLHLPTIQYGVKHTDRGCIG
jgi:hypothetical protein